ncbi:MAG: trypsin-like peptidase domain-containing protein [Candidatus Omnitrophica bacterium]|nr:trypsin-like peptidase domain-containing protein [Candidatus Omnitrophota bacterium]
MFKKSDKLICLLLVLVFSGLITHRAIAANAEQNNGSLQLMLQIEDAVSNAAESAGNAVVGISTERNKQVMSYFRNYGEDFLNEFFRNFFFGDSSQREYKQIGLGSGVIFNSEGYILTNEHVIAAADKITVTLADGRQFMAILKGSDYRADLALIKIDAADLPYAEFGDSGALKTGQWAIAIGNPFSFAVTNPKPSVTLGVISALERSVPSSSNINRAYLDLIQTDAAINPGNSGGPLLNIQGEVIGINVAIFSSGGGSEGIGFAIPINDAKLMLEDLLWGEKVLYAWVGIVIQDINYVLCEQFDLKKAQGVLILKVLENSPAKAAGLRAQDIILKFNSEKVENSIDFMKKISRSKPGDIIKLKIIRNSLQRTIRLKLSKMPKELDKAQIQNPLKIKKEIPEIYDQSILSENSKKAASKTQLQIWRGMKVAEITKEFANNFKIETDIGVVVTKVIAGTPAEEAGIRVKDIITQINTYNVETLEDYLFAVSKASGKVLIKTNRAYLMIKDQ